MASDAERSDALDDMPATAKGDAWLGLGGGDLSPSLASLDLSWCTLARLPKGIADLTALTELRLAGAQVALPNSLSLLTTISMLDLSYSVASLPPFVASLPRLRTLLLAGNAIAALPPLSLLQSLDLHGARFAELPSGLSALRSLTSLHLSRASLSSLPLFLSSLPLRIVDVSFNRLTSLSPLFACPLRQLRAQANLLTSAALAVPSSSPNLILLDLSHNSITSLPVLSSLTSLMMLHLAHNALRSLPLLSPLTRLRLLSVSHNRLRVLPDLVALSSLRSLLLHCNRISTLPNLPPFPHLAYLSLASNSISWLPDLSSVTSLLSLSLSCNRISSALLLPSSLTSLFAAHNALPRNALSTSPLPRLEELSISHNPLLRRLPSPLASSLRHLHASTCGLKRFPASLLPALRSLHLANNPRLRSHSSASSSSSISAIPRAIPELFLSDPSIYASSSIAYAAALGRRPQQEDAHVVHTFPDQSMLVALFDGHGGLAAARHAASSVVSTLSPLISSFPASASAALGTAIRSLHASFQTAWKSSNADLSAVAPGASAVLVLRNGKRLSVANVGDTRAVLVRGRTALRLSEEHKPYEDSEMALIMRRGGQVVGDGHAGYVNRRLAISRAIGDFYLSPFVSCDPYTVEVTLSEEDTHLIVACDGLWDVCSEAHAARICRNTTDAPLAAAMLRDLAFALGSDDNV